MKITELSLNDVEYPCENILSLIRAGDLTGKVTIEFVTGEKNGKGAAVPHRYLIM